MIMIFHPLDREIIGGAQAKSSSLPGVSTASIELQRLKPSRQAGLGSRSVRGGDRLLAKVLASAGYPFQGCPHRAKVTLVARGLVLDNGGSVKITPFEVDFFLSVLANLGPEIFWSKIFSETDTTNRAVPNAAADTASAHENQERPKSPEASPHTRPQTPHGESFWQIIRFKASIESVLGTEKRLHFHWAVPPLFQWKRGFSAVAECVVFRIPNELWVVFAWELR